MRACRLCHWLALGFALLSAATSASAHSARNSVVSLDFEKDSLRADLILPLNELELAFKQPLMAAPDTVVATYGPALRSYVLEHVKAETPDARQWSVEVSPGPDALIVQPGDPNQEASVPDLLVQLRLTPPHGAPLRQLTLHYDVICHEVNNHSAFFEARRDYERGLFGSAPEPLGMVQYTVKTLAVDRSGGHWWVGFRSILRAGMSHIAEGTDHLLFLLVLLLPAPLLTQGQRWGGFRGVKGTLLQVLKTVTAFTIGHSLTLAIASVGWVRLPTQPVEIVIAVSILASALHAWRPIFRGRETWVAAGFGLIHGLAFAELLSGYGLTGGYFQQTLLAFNLGIELQQLIIVACALPVIILIARTRWEKPLRLTAAAGAAIMAAWWIWERIAE